jgi:hypothetical protein
MATWAAITPDGGPRAVEQARARVDQLRARIADERGRVEQAERDLAAAEAADRDQMAKAFADDREPTSNTKEVERARAAVAEAQRRQAALDTAVNAADVELGQAVEQTRGKWRADCDTAATKAREQARRSLGQLEAALAEVNRHAAIAAWLAPDGRADAGHPVKPLLATVPGTERVTANSQPIGVTDLLAWLALVVEPAPPAPPQRAALAEAATVTDAA